MYQFLKTHFSFQICFLVITAGCAQTKVSKEFSDIIKDGSRVAIKIEYKPKSVMNSQGEKFGSYYFVAKHFSPSRQNPKSEFAKAVRAYEKKHGYDPHIYISFYDREGHLLLKRFTPDGSAMNFANHEENIVDGNMVWKGQFDEGVITVHPFHNRGMAVIDYFLIGNYKSLILCNQKISFCLNQDLQD